jgi:hypothetical protein
MQEKISVQNFVEEFTGKKVINTKLNDHAVEDFIHEKIDIIEYIPFTKKIDIINNIISEIVEEVDGVKKINSVAQYMAFMIAMLSSHTTLEFNDVYDDYDALNKYGLIEQIVTLFQKDFAECETLLKMLVADELADNNLNVIVGKFLNGILAKLDGFGEVVKGFAENLDLSKLLGTNINEEEKAKILGIIDKINK